MIFRTWKKQKKKLPGRTVSKPMAADIFLRYSRKQKTLTLEISRMLCLYYAAEMDT